MLLRCYTLPFYTILGKDALCFVRILLKYDKKEKYV